MAEIEQVLAQIFRKKGKASLTEKEFVFAASLDLRWFTPKEAQKLLDIALEGQLLIIDGGKLSPNFDHLATVTPQGFSPSSEVLRTAVQPKGVFLKLVDEITSKEGMPRKEAISLINNTQDRMDVDIEVAALVVAHSLNIDITQYLDSVEEDVATGYKKKI